MHSRLPFSLKISVKILFQHQYKRIIKNRFNIKKHTLIAGKYAFIFLHNREKMTENFRFYRKKSIVMTYQYSIITYMYID